MTTATDTDQKTPRVRGDLLARIRAGHEDPRLRTQQSLGTYADVSLRSVARAEQGFATFETVEKLAATLGVSPWTLWVPLDASVATPDVALANTSDAAEHEAASIDELMDRVGEHPEGLSVHDQLTTILSRLDALEHMR